MARERKPLIEPGSLLPTAETLMSRILERDRQASGRKSTDLPSPEQDNLIEEEIDTSLLHNTTPKNITSNITAQKENRAERKPRRKASEQSETLSDGDMHTLLETQTLARKMAETRAIPITLRLPEGLNDWLDDYSHQHRKRGVKKQDLIARAVEMLVISLSISDIETHE